MTKTWRVLGVLPIGVAMIAAFAILGQSQERRDNAQPHSLERGPGVPEPSPSQMSPDEKLVRDAYARLMRYHTAWLNELAATSERAENPDEYVIFEVRNVVTGNIEEIYDRPLVELVTAGGTEFLKVTPHHLSHGNGPQHAYYEVEWAAGSANNQGDDKRTVRELLMQSSGPLGYNAKYTSYEVTVRVKGKERTYRALALRDSSGQSGGKPTVQILDQTTTEMNSVLGDESPRVNSPWAKYVKSGLYLAVAKLIRETQRGGKPLIPVGAPIGYLPGDNLTPIAATALAPQATCEPPRPTISGNVTLWWFNGYSPSGYATKVTLTASPVGQTSYQWTIVQGTGFADFSNNADGMTTTTCIDCDLCRQIAPDTFKQAGEQSVVYHQPDDAAEELAAMKALITCPTASIGDLAKRRMVAAVSAYPELVADNVYFCGFASESSYGASSYLIVRPEGNVLVDSPRFAGPLVRRIAEMGGVRRMFLTHRDDVADHDKWAARFESERIMHRDDVGRIKGIERPLNGRDPVYLDEELLAIPTPGHTAGHTVLLYRDKYLFTGDHLWWSPTYRSLHASASVCWYSWPEQTTSVERLLDYGFEWVLPGHGRRAHASRDQMRGYVQECVARMRTVTRRAG
ncbi:MAG TPA: MBL fold metallo-hydrolase [Blastocatellia bacterium]|nr:MBL fold metallo-hydrolase [Blastocatellia bacterium]